MVSPEAKARYPLPSSLRCTDTSVSSCETESTRVPYSTTCVTELSAVVDTSSVFSSLPIT